MRTKVLKPMALIMMFVLSFSFLEATFLPVNVQAYGDDNPIIVVSMGDSYSAGEGIEPFYGQTNPDGSDVPRALKIHSADWIAHRSTKSWPSLLKVGDFNVRDYKKNINGLDAPGLIGSSDSSACEWYFVAATGAVTDNFDNPYERGIKKNKDGKDENIVKTYIGGSPMKPESYKVESDSASKLDPQLQVFEDNNLKGRVDYVTMTIGGNDLGFTEIVIDSVKSTFFNPNSLKNLIAQKRKLWFTEIKEKLKQSYKKVYEAAGPQAEIIVVGYPELYYRDKNTWAAGREQRKIIDNFVVEFCDQNNGRIVEAINECNLEFAYGKIHYVSVIEEFHNHGADAPNGNEWINGITLTGTQMIDESDITQKAYPSMHPNEEGAKAYARCVNAKIKEIEDSKRNGTISGKVVTEDNKPIGNATVKCGDKTVKTNGNGEYTISLPSGNYYFEVSCDGYQTAKIANIAVQPGKTTNLNNIVLKKENAQDYKAAFIQALLDNESEWNKEEYDGLKLLDTYFFDVDFDGKPELLTKFGDHNYRTYKTYVYYYENGLKKYKSPINDGKANFEVYLDTKNQNHILRGKNVSGTMVGAGGTHYFDIEINRESSKSTLYACDSWIRDPSSREVTHTYYKYNNVTYTTLEEAYNSKIEITEDEYNKIMAEKSEGLEPVSVDYESLHSGDYGKYNAAQKKSALEKAYDSFCIVQRSDQIQYYNGKRYYTIEQNLNMRYPKFDFSQARPDYVALPSLSGSIDGSEFKSSKFSFDNFIIADDKIYFTKEYPFDGPCDTANLYVCDINGKNIALICEHVFSRFVYSNGNIYFQHENAGVYDSGTGSYGFERTNKDTYNIATGKITGHSHNFDLEFQGKIMEWWPNSVSDTRRYYDGAFYYVKSYPQEQDVNAGNMRLHLKTSDNKDYVVGRWWNQVL